MAVSEKRSIVNSLISLVALVFLLAGVYGAIRVGINKFFYPKYPTFGIFTFNFYGIPPYNQKEEDCFYPITYYTEDGQKARPATEEEKAIESKNQEGCVRGVADTRRSAAVNDISAVALFLTLGLGILASRKFLF